MISTGGIISQSDSLQKIKLHELNADSLRHGILLRHFQCPFTQVNGKYIFMGKIFFDGYGNATAPGSNIKDGQF